MNQTPSCLAVVPEEAGHRLDQFVAGRYGEFSRSRIQKLIEEGFITVNGKTVRSSHKVRGGDHVEVVIPAARPVAAIPQAIPLDIIYEDASIIVVNKPAGMVVHPAAGNYEGTLVNALLAHCHDLSGIGGELRPGIVHRLDKGTSGVMVAAKDDEAHLSLSAQFRDREVRKQYLALVLGDPPDEGTVELAIGRHYRDRKLISTKTRKGREAVSRFRVLERFGDAALAEVMIATGRTHQIRVHMAHLGHPVAGDDTYGGVRAKSIGKTKILRPMLHAAVLEFTHPRNGEKREFRAELPSDMCEIIEALRRRGAR